MILEATGMRRPEETLRYAAMPLLRANGDIYIFRKNKRDLAISNEHQHIAEGLGAYYDLAESAALSIKTMALEAISMRRSEVTLRYAAMPLLRANGDIYIFRKNKQDLAVSNEHHDVAKGNENHGVAKGDENYEAAEGSKIYEVAEGNEHQHIAEGLEQLRCCRRQRAAPMLPQATSPNY